MARDWKPSRGSYVILDTNIIIHMRNSSSGYSAQIIALVEKIIENGVQIVIPQIVRYELLRHEENFGSYNNTELFLGTYNNYLIDSTLIDSALQLENLYYSKQNMRNAKKKDEKNIFNDMIIGSIATAIEYNESKSVYILSGDGDYKEPYFKIIADYLFENKRKYETHYFFLYRAQRFLMNKHWKEFIAS